MTNKTHKIDLHFETPLSPTLKFLVLLLNQPKQNDPTQIEHWKNNFDKSFIESFTVNLVPYNNSELSFALKNQKIELNNLDKWFSFGMLKQTITHTSELKRFNNFLFVSSILEEPNLLLFLDAYKKKFIDPIDFNSNKYLYSQHLSILKETMVLQLFLGNLEKAQIISDFHKNTIDSKIKQYKIFGKSGSDPLTKRIEDEPASLNDTIKEMHQYATLGLLNASLHFQNPSNQLNDIQALNQKTWDIIKNVNQPNNVVKQSKNIMQPDFYPDLLSQFYKNANFGFKQPKLTQCIFKILEGYKVIQDLPVKIQAQFLYNVYQKDPKLEKTLQEHFTKRLENLIYCPNSHDKNLAEVIIETGKIFSVDQEKFKLFGHGFHNWCLNKPSLYWELNNLPQWQEFEQILEKHPIDTIGQDLWNKKQLPFSKSFFANADSLERLKKLNIKWTDTKDLSQILEVINLFLNSNNLSKRIVFLEQLLKEIAQENPNLLTDTNEQNPQSITQRIKNGASIPIKSLFESILLKQTLDDVQYKKSASIKL